MTDRRRNPAVLAALVALALVASACTASATSTPTTTGHTSPPSTSAAPPPTTAPAAVPVPAAYPTAYQRLSGQLDAYQAAVSAMPDYRSSDPSTPAFVAGAELLAANGNRQAQLLAPGTLTAVDQELDALKRLGVTGVTIGVKLPLLLPQFEPQAVAYANFYASVAAAVRSRGMFMDVELGGLFCGTVYATCSFAYPKTVDGWAQLTAQQATTVIDRMHPDVVDLMSEPNTEAILTGIHALATLPGVVQFVTTTLTAIGPHAGTELGAGAASWFPASFDQAIAATPVDVLIDHIYPIGPTVAQTLVATAAIAHTTHKPLVVDEVGLYKGTPTAGGNVEQSSNEGRVDAYSFWQPLDQRFLSITRLWAQKADVAYASVFWSNQLFAYATWTPQLESAPPQQTLAALDQAAAGAMAAGAATDAGRTWTGKN
jgi:hypothetical protein